MGSDDASINPLTYATTFQTPQGNYTFVSEDFINKGVKSGDTTYVNKNFLDPATLSNFLSNATAVDLSKAKASGITSIPTWGEWVTQRLGQSPKGYLVKGDAPFDSSGFVTLTKDTPTGLAKNASGKLVYNLGNNRYLESTGTVRQVS